MQLSEQTFEFACTARTRFAKGDPKTKKQILATIGSNLTLKDKKLSIEARKPFFFLEDSMTDEKRETEPIEPDNTGLAYTQKEAFASPPLRLLGELNDVRAYRHKAERAAALIYAHFKKEFGDSIGGHVRNN